MKLCRGLCVLALLAQCSVLAAVGSRFASHISVNTPARSFSHGVGDPLPTIRTGRRFAQPGLSVKTQPVHAYRSIRRPTQRHENFGGYQHVKPSIPFTSEETLSDNSIHSSPWQQNIYNNFREFSIPVLPPSPYKVDSPDPESLWPEGLFLPPIAPHRFGPAFRRNGNELTAGSDAYDPYLLEGSEAIAAVKRANDHGLYYFHDIPHIPSLLANQELRVKNKLKPHRIASLRHTWPYKRP